MSQPFINLRAIGEARLQQQRRAFVNRHRVPEIPLPWFTFILGFASGITVLLVALHLVSSR